MITVRPISFTVVNWKAIQSTQLELNCISVLERSGVKKEDPAALPMILSGMSNLRDSSALRFAMLQFLVITPKWTPVPTMLDEHTLGSIKDAEGTLHTALILSGTADVWRTVLQEECTPVRDHDPVRLKIFNICYETICRTGLRIMFESTTKQRQLDGTFLLQARNGK